MKSVQVIACVAIAALVAGCAAKTAKRDAYADAATVKQKEIERLSTRIAELRASSDSVSVARQIDSLEAIRSIAQASLGGINGVVVEEQKRREDNLRGTGLIGPPSDSAMNKKYPIKRP